MKNPKFWIAVLVAGIVVPCLISWCRATCLPTLIILNRLDADGH